MQNGRDGDPVAAVCVVNLCLRVRMLAQGPFGFPRENFQGEVLAGHSAVIVTVNDTRGLCRTGGFVSVTKGNQFEITPLVRFSASDHGSERLGDEDRG